MADNQYFAGNPIRLDISRSRMTSRPRWTGTWKTGVLVPIYATSLVLPGSTYAMSISSAIRMATPNFPTMDDIDITIEAFFVPHRLILSRQTMSPTVNDSTRSWEAFIGAQDSILNMPTPTGIRLPSFIVGRSTNYQVGGLADCLGMPPVQGDSGEYEVNCLKPLAFYSIWNEYFRDPNTASPVTFSIASYGSFPALVHLYGTDAGIDGVSNIWFHLGRLGLPTVSRYHGYFGSALPWPQRNSEQVSLPLGDIAPVTTLAVDASDVTKPNPVLSSEALRWQNGYSIRTENGTLINTSDGTQIKGTSEGEGIQSVAPANLFADLSSATAATVNQFRLAVQTQRFYEALARSGNKYHDLLNGIWGVRNANVQDRPEYLGGFTAPINMSQVAQTTGGSGQVGQVGAFSLSNPSGFLFKKSFTEHGTIMVVACCRVKDSFAQGIAREDTKFDSLEFYVPQFANLGEQPILNKELYVSGTAATDNAVFGYQEAWAEYRMDEDKVVGLARPNAPTSLSYLTYANNFASAPTLKGFLEASAQQTLVDRTLAVPGSTSGLQFFGQFQFQITKILPMPLYSIPGLVDHH